MSRPQPHQHRTVAESFGIDAARYDRTRPPYPQALIERVVAASPGHDILDVGCGTGTEARQFLDAGCTVLGVEPDERMADIARRHAIDVEVAKFEDWDAAGRSFDAVVAGTAWHWVDPTAGPLKAARVLRPGGLLAPFHHTFQPPVVIAEALADVYRRVAPDSPFNPGSAFARSAVDAYQPLFDRIADGMRQAGVFSEPVQWRFDWERTYARDEWLDQLPTFGGLTQLSPEDLATVVAAVGTAVDGAGGEVTVLYATIAVTASLLTSR